jgi:hypothetical protein
MAWSRILAGEAPLDGALVSAARQALLQFLPTNELARVLQAGIWNSNRTGVAVSVPKAKGSLVFVFVRQTNGVYVAADATGVEGCNLAKLGVAGPEAYDRIETTPIRWEPREGGGYHVEMRTRAWKGRKRYTVSEPLFIRLNGTIGWR